MGTSSVKQEAVRHGQSWLSCKDKRPLNCRPCDRAHLTPRLAYEFGYCITVKGIRGLASNVLAHTPLRRKPPPTSSPPAPTPNRTDTELDTVDIHARHLRVLPPDAFTDAAAARRTPAP